ncbi:MAG: hypothetical protein M3033_06730 [Acidobacteriota bacterium]|nr:hypothetical protein [Acidobacteriota bacterium]
MLANLKKELIMNLVVVDSSFGKHDSGGVLATDRAIHPGAILAGSVAQMVELVLARLGSSNKIDTIRFWGHGGPGRQGVGVGSNRHWVNHPLERIIGVNSHGFLLNRRVLLRLRGKFESFGLVELHGCHTGDHLQGKQLLQRLNEIWHVPVRAAIGDQASDMADRFFGGVVEAYGGGNSHPARVHMVPAGVRQYWTAADLIDDRPFWNIF